MRQDSCRAIRTYANPEGDCPTLRPHSSIGVCGVCYVLGLAATGGTGGTGPLGHVLGLAATGGTGGTGPLGGDSIFLVCWDVSWHSGRSVCIHGNPSWHWTAQGPR